MEKNQNKHDEYLDITPKDQQYQDHKTEEVFLIVGFDPSNPDCEGVWATSSIVPEILIPLIATNETMLNHLIPIADDMQKSIEKENSDVRPYKILRFSNREDITDKYK